MDPNIYKEHYEFEWSHRSHLTSALNIPIAVSTVLGGAEVVLLQKFPYAKDIPTSLFLFFSVCSVISLITAIVYLFKAVHGYRYQRVPTPFKIKKHYDDLISWWGRNGGTEENAKDDLKSYINQRMGEAIEINATNNKNKSAYIHKSNGALIFSLIFLAICSIPFLVKMVNEPQKTVKVEIVNFATQNIQEAIMQDDDKIQQPINVVPDNDPKPVGPPNEEIKEDKIITTERTASDSE